MDKANSQVRRHISKKQRRFIERHAELGFLYPYRAGEEVGIPRATEVDKLLVRLHDIIEAERLRRAMGRQMEVDEALVLVAGIARTRDDPKIQHAALRTVLEVHGVLTGQPRVDRREAMRTIYQLVAAIKEKVQGGAKVRMKLQERVLEVGGEEEANVQRRESEEKG
jgi:hypothetical protein